MTTRYFEIRSPLKDFTGRVGAIAFADGVARVSFDDTRDDHGTVVAEEHQVATGRSAVMFARRRRGYTVVETNAAGTPLDLLDPEPAPAESGEGRPAKSASTELWRAYAKAQGMDDQLAEGMSRDALVAHYEAKEAGK